MGGRGRLGIPVGRPRKRVASVRAKVLGEAGLMDKSFVRSKICIGAGKGVEGIGGQLIMFSRDRVVALT